MQLSCGGGIINMKNDCNSSSTNLYYLVLEEIREKIKDSHPYGITQESLAKELGVSREHLTRMLSGKYSMDAIYFLSLCVELGLIELTF